MDHHKFYYLLRLEYLGFRYSGWQKQPGQLTIEGVLHKTLKYILPNQKFKLLASGRTDAKVSALNAAVELFLFDQPITDLKAFMSIFNKNLPPDVKVIAIEEKTSDFNIIQSPKLKEYLYLFSFGEKNHPFCAPLMTNFPESLDIKLMQLGANMFVGKHDFSVYTARLKPNTTVIREVTHCKIKENALFTANFFPKKSYILVVRGAGFMRYQIRMMMGALYQLGMNELTMEDLKASLEPKSTHILTTVAPGSGLILNDITFN